jgi:alpha-mannosidase
VLLGIALSGSSKNVVHALQVAAPLGCATGPPGKRAIRRETVDIPKFKYYEGQCPEAQQPGFDDSRWPDFEAGDFWGGYDVVAWFRARVHVPAGWKGRKLALRFQVGPRDGGGSTAESLLYVNGTPLQGIDVWHEEAWLPPEVLEQGELLVALKAWSGVLDVPDRRCFKLAQLVWIDEGAERFYSLADTLLKSIKLLDENDLRRARLLELLNRSFHCIDFLKPRSVEFYGSLEGAGQFLDAGLSRLQAREIKACACTGTRRASTSIRKWIGRSSRSC